MSSLLVFLQFVLISLIAYPFQKPDATWLSVVFFTSGLSVFGLAIWTMKRPTFTIMPEPKASGRLVTTGIYAVIRHPMYLAVLLCALGANLAYDVEWKWACAGTLGLVLWVKLRREEAMLVGRYAEYAAYRQRTKALVPFLL